MKKKIPGTSKNKSSAPGRNSAKAKSINKKTNDVKKITSGYRTKIVTNIEKLSKIQAAQDKKIKQPKREIAKARKELSRIRSKVYRLNAKEKSIRGRGSKAKKEAIRLEREKYIQDNKARINAAISKRDAAKDIAKIKVKILADRRRLKNEMKRLDVLLREADDSGNTKEFNRLLDEKEDIIDMMDASIEAMDEIRKEADISGYKPYEGEFDAGFVLSPLSPMSIWEAQEKLESDVKSGKYKFFIINGTKISSDNDGMVTEEMRQLRYYMDSAPGGVSTTPKVNIYYNRSVPAAKYESE